MSFYTIGRKAEKASSLIQINKELLEENYFKDVTLVSDDLHEMKAHKALLSKSSDVFRKILLLKDDKDPIIFIRGTSKEQLKSLLNFIYVGEAEVTEKDMNSFVQLAKDFEIKEFVDSENQKELTSNIQNEKIHLIEESIANIYETDTEEELDDNDTDDVNWTEHATGIECVESKENFMACKNKILKSAKIATEGGQYNVNMENIYDTKIIGEKSSLQTVKDKKEEHDDMIKDKPNVLDRKVIKQVVTRTESLGRIACADNDCKKIFTKSQNMRAHYKVSHEGFDICGYNTTRSNTLRKHKQNNH